MMVTFSGALALLRRRLMLWWCLGFSLAIASCAIVEPMHPPHIVITRNVGSGVLSDVVIDYGKSYVLRNSTPGRPGRMTDNGVTAPVPEVMTVKWKTANGQEHSVPVPLKSRVTYVEKLRGFEILFFDDRLEVYHLTTTGTKDEFTHRRRIFPE